MNAAATTKAFAAMTHSFFVHQQCGRLLQIACKEKKKTTGGRSFWKPECIILKERDISKIDWHSDH